jgi:hypothetical protein
MKIKILKKFSRTIYAAHMHNLITFPAQFVQIFTLFFKKFQTKILLFNALSTRKLFFTCTNGAAITPISADNQPNSTCTISSITCTICTTQSANPLTINKLKSDEIMHPLKYLKTNITNSLS